MILFSMLATVVAALICAALLILNRRTQFTADSVAPSQPQAVHERAVPRIGGFAVITAMMCASGFAHSDLAWGLLSAAMLSFTAGFAEDLTGRVSPVERYAMALIAGLLVYAFMDVRITRLDIPLLDEALRFAPLALLLTAFAVASFTHAMNLLDGLHGLSAGTAFIAMAATTAVAQHTGDTDLAVASWIAGGALLGFFVVNFPWGRIFLGDGGAYLSGTLLACLVILLVRRNPDVSPWFAVVALAHPIAETLLTVVRRAALHRSPLGAPDIFHVHSLCYQLLLHRLNPRVSRNACNALASSGLLLLNGAMAAMAVAFWNRTDFLMAQFALFALAYAGLWYWLMHHAALRPAIDARKAMPENRAPVKPADA